MARCYAVAVAGGLLHCNSIHGTARMNKMDGIEVTFLYDNSRHLMLMSGGADKDRIEWMCSNLEDWGYRVLRQICKAHYIDGVLVKGGRL